MIKLAYALVLLSAVAIRSGQVTDSNLGYAITLPANWVQLKSKPQQHYFRDSTRQYHSQISIVRYAIDRSSYSTPESWTQAQFIAYKLSVENTVYPYGAILYYDSSSAAILSSKWAPEAFSILYPADGDPTYCEFLRYCANGNFGYEIYAIGDSADMVNQVDFYSEIIATIRFSQVTTSLIVPERGAESVPALGPGLPAFDVRGRRTDPAKTRTPRIFSVAP